MVADGDRVGGMPWAEFGACRGGDPDQLFVQGAAQHRAKRVCDRCPVRLDCAVEALNNRIEFGVWGGLTERQRRTILSRRPDVVSWRPLLLGLSPNKPAAPAA